MLRKQTHSGSEAGMVLVETIIALAILGATAVIFLGGLLTTSRAAYIADERGTAMSLSQQQMEWVKAADYTDNATQYSAAPLPDGKDYLGYSITITAEPLRTPDDGIQRITIKVNRSGGSGFILESYKVDR
ncbi:MAG: type II secretion system protein [Dehalococcoidales bacterium]|nr:type II secretion system protein [Dehalococcoidales bacterium]